MIYNTSIKQEPKGGNVIADIGCEFIQYGSRFCAFDVPNITADKEAGWEE